MKKIGLLFGALLWVTVSTPALAVVDFTFSFNPELVSGPATGNVIFRATVLNTGTENIVGRTGSANFNFDELGAYATGGNFGPTSSFSDFEAQFVGLDLAPGSSFSFVFGNITYAGAPDGTYRVGTDSDIAFSGVTGAETSRVVGNAALLSIGDTAVPEPATWTMMILGFGVIGAAMRRRTARRTSLHFAF